MTHQIVGGGEEQGDAWWLLYTGAATQDDAGDHFGRVVCTREGCDEVVGIRVSVGANHVRLLLFRNLLTVACSVDSRSRTQDSQSPDVISRYCDTVLCLIQQSSNATRSNSAVYVGSDSTVAHCIRRSSIILQFVIVGRSKTSDNVSQSRPR